MQLPAELSVLIPDVLNSLHVSLAPPLPDMLVHSVTA